MKYATTKSITPDSDIDISVHHQWMKLGELSDTLRINESVLDKYQHTANIAVWVPGFNDLILSLCDDLIGFSLIVYFICKEIALGKEKYRIS